MFKINIPQSESKIFTFSNFLSISRILLLPFILIILRDSSSLKNNLLLMFLICLVILTDFLDGFFARKLNQISVLGKVLDPIADKICIGSIAIFLTLYRDFPSWLTVIIVGRDILIVLAGLLLVSKIKEVVASNFIGKYTVFFLSLLLVSYLFEIEIVKLPLTIISMICIVLSLISYSKRLVKSYS
jgi:CDP-diacylglycerol---glycerol-3-phosphate 3-phosphatidyltransferase